MATSFALEAGSFVRPSIHKVLGPPLSYATPLKHLGPPLSYSGLFVRGCSVVLHEDSCISTRDHSGGSVIPHPVALMPCQWPAAKKIIAKNVRPRQPSKKKDHKLRGTARSNTAFKGFGPLSPNPKQKQHETQIGFLSLSNSQTLLHTEGK
jgi:hypothetical protein